MIKKVNKQRKILKRDNKINENSRKNNRNANFYHHDNGGR